MLADRLACLYRGQTNVWGAVHGEQIKRPLAAADWIDHVNGHGSVGVYPLVCVRGVWSVHWCAVDIDDGYDSSFVTAKNLQKACEVLGLTTWIERSKGKGFHLLLFADDWFPALHARAVMLLACHLTDYRPKEIYPKQVTLADGQSGNYLNAAYAAQHVGQEKRVVLDPHALWPLRLETFLDQAEASLNTPEKIAAVAAIYKEEPKKAPLLLAPNSGHPSQALLSPLTRKVFEEGPLPHLETGHIDRSAGLQKLAHLCAADGLTPSQTLLLVTHLDLRLGKYAGRSDAETQLEKIVRNAYER